MRVATRGKAHEPPRGRETGSVEILVAPSGVQEAEQADLRDILASELGKLPLRSQMPVVLCDLEGLTHEEAARRLGVPAGTIKSRLSRAREQLRSRLARRGLTSTELFVLAVPGRSVLTEALVDSTVRAAQSFLAGQPAAVGTAVVSASVAALTQGVIKSMFLTKLKVTAAALLLVSGSAVPGPAGDHAPNRFRRGRQRNLFETAPPRSRPAAAELDVAMLEAAWLAHWNEATRPSSIASWPTASRASTRTATLSPGRGICKEVANGAYVNWPIEPIDIAIRSFGDTAVLTSLTQIKNPAHDRRYTKVYVKQDGRWQCVASHESLLMGVDNTAGADGNSSGGMMMMGTPGQPGDQNAGGMAGMMATMMGNRGNPSNANPQGGMAGMMGGNPVANANPRSAGAA